MSGVLHNWLQTAPMREISGLASPFPERAVIVRWADGDEVLVELDGEFFADEMDDGVEGWVVDVVKVLGRATGSKRYLPEGKPAEIRADDPPDIVMSTDRKRTWRRAAD